MLHYSKELAEELAGFIEGPEVAVTADRSTLTANPGAISAIQFRASSAARAIVKLVATADLRFDHPNCLNLYGVASQLVFHKAVQSLQGLKRQTKFCAIIIINSFPF